MDNEFTLSGGRSTDGVVRVGDTVRRPHKNESEFTNSFLSFLWENGFSHSQRYIGRDEHGRDIFEYIKGFVPDDIGNTTLEQLCEFMKVVKKFHDLSLQFTHTSQVVCHNDLSPCNTVKMINLSQLSIGIVRASANAGRIWHIFFGYGLILVATQGIKLTFLVR